MKKCKTIALANQKGGTGKTTTAFNLAYALSEMGTRVLIVDMDPQANLSRCYGITDFESIEMPLSEIIKLTLMESEMNIHDYVLRDRAVHLLPSNINLAVTERNLANEVGGEMTLNEILAPLRPNYDFILIDTNPSLGNLTVNALAACDSVIIPVSLELWSAVGLSDLLSSIMKARRRINPRIQVEGIVLTMYDKRLNVGNNVMELLHREYAGMVPIYNTLIPRRAKVSDANYYSQSIGEYAPGSPAADAYSDLAKEVMANGNEHGHQTATA